MARAFTTKAIENLKPDQANRQEIPDPALSGLYLVVQPSGVKSWAVRYRHAGKPRKLTLGKWPIIGLADARLAASEALEAVEHGRDPGQEKKAAKAASVVQADRDTVEALIDLYAKRHLSKLKSGATAKRELERHAVEAWRGRDVHTITKRDVLDLLDGIVDSGRATSANRVRAYLSKFFNWCIERDVIEFSPMIGVKAPAKEKSRDRVLNDDEIRWFWRACDRVGQPWGALGKLLLLTGQRRGEVAEMTDSEISESIWHLSADRTKNGRAHDVPLSDVAQDVLSGLERIKSDAGYLHTTTGQTPISGFQKARTNVAKHMLEIASEERGEPVEIPKWTWHDLRRTAETGMARLKVSQDVIDRVTNHISGQHRMARIYNRYEYMEEKRSALEAWARFITTLVDGGADNVVELAR